MCTLTSCSEHITSSVHLPSHFPILEGSGRGLEPRRLRGKDESPFRSRPAKRLGSNHSLPKWPEKASWHPVARDSRSQRGTHLDCWGLSVNCRAAFRRERRGRPLLTGLLRSNQHRRPDHLGHTFQRGDTQRHKERKLSQRASGYEQKWVSYDAKAHGRERAERSDPAVLPRLMEGCMHSVTDKANRCDSPISRNRRALASSPPHGPYSPLNIRCGKLAHSDDLPYWVWIWARLLRLPPSLSTIGAGAVAGGAAEKRERGGGGERERERLGVGALTVTPSRRSRVDSADLRTWARARTAARRPGGAQRNWWGARAGGSDSRE